MTEIRTVAFVGKDDRKLAYFLHHYLAKTHNAKLIVVVDEHDTVNAEVLEYFALAHADMFEVALEECYMQGDYVWHYMSTGVELEDGWDTKARAHSV